MTSTLRRPWAAALLALGLAGPLPSPADDKVLNLYSARHYQTDEALYANFTKSTGIRIQRIDADDAGLLARLKAEGSSSPADVILLVDAARLWRGEVEGLFQPVKSELLASRIPAHLRGKEDAEGSRWFGFSTRARAIVIDKATVRRNDADTYEKLADPINKGRLCIRSAAHPYNLSLFGALLEHWGAQRTEGWLKGLSANLARAPKGGDIDQIRGVGSGECSIALSNTYYIARLLSSDKPEDKLLMSKVEIIMPDQLGAGTHVNVAGGAIARHAPHRTQALQFLEYLASPQAQKYFAEGNHEWPAVKGVPLSNTVLNSFGSFKQDTVPVARIGMNQVKIQQMLDRVGLR